jgi:hypothetical protein
VQEQANCGQRGQPTSAQPAMPVIGFLRPGAPEANAHLVAAFRNGLGEIGYVEGRQGAWS